MAVPRCAKCALAVVGREGRKALGEKVGSDEPTCTPKSHAVCQPLPACFSTSLQAFLQPRPGLNTEAVRRMDRWTKTQRQSHAQTLHSYTYEGRREVCPTETESRVRVIGSWRVWLFFLCRQGRHVSGHERTIESACTACHFLNQCELIAHGPFKGSAFHSAGGN